jgi:hypothetical protein
VVSTEVVVEIDRGIWRVALIKASEHEDDPQHEEGASGDGADEIDGR